MDYILCSYDYGSFYWCLLNNQKFYSLINITDLLTIHFPEEWMKGCQIRYKKFLKLINKLLLINSNNKRRKASCRYLNESEDRRNRSFKLLYIPRKLVGLRILILYPVWTNICLWTRWILGRYNHSTKIVLGYSVDLWHNYKKDKEILTAVSRNLLDFLQIKQFLTGKYVINFQTNRTVLFSNYKINNTRKSSKY